jgi:hypothetical protein
LVGTLGGAGSSDIPTADNPGSKLDPGFQFRETSLFPLFFDPCPQSLVGTSAERRARCAGRQHRDRHVVQSRYDDARPTIATSGLTPAQIVERYSSGIARRLLETAGGVVVVQIKGFARRFPQGE